MEERLTRSAMPAEERNGSAAAGAASGAVAGTSAGSAAGTHKIPAAARGAGAGDEILAETRNHVAVLTLNRPAALNALTLGMIVELRERLEQAAADPDIRAVLLQGAGNRAFCAGADIRALYHGHLARRAQAADRGGTAPADFFAEEYPLDYLLQRYPKATVVCMDGIVMGGGMGLAQGSTLRLVGDATRMAMPETAIGLFPDVGASHFLSRLRGSLGKYLGITGVSITGADAIAAGLADSYLPAGAAVALSEALEDIRWSDDPHEALRRFVGQRAIAPPAAPLAGLYDAIDHHFCRPTVGEILHSLECEVRPQHAAWAEATIRLMRSRSPLMMCVTLRQLEIGRSLDLASALRMELDMTTHCLEEGDFIEGVRALLIDKDKQPAWRPARLEEVTPALIERFFESPWPAESHPLAHLTSTEFPS